jgi:hypothetical protein
LCSSRSWTACADCALRPASDELPGWVVVALPSAGWPLSAVDEQARRDALPGLGYRIVTQDGTVVLYRRATGP